MIICFTFLQFPVYLVKEIMPVCPPKIILSLNIASLKFVLFISSHISTYYWRILNIWLDHRFLFCFLVFQNSFCVALAVLEFHL